MNKMKQKIYDISPVIKWAGGKRQLLDKIKNKAPNDFNNYYEPFIGGGAVLFGLADLLNYKEIVINDINLQLVNLYNVIKNNSIELIKELENLDFSHENSEDKKVFYYMKRDEYNKKITDLNIINDVKMAALTIYINKHCFNGLYRVNSSGLFNVPFNGKEKGNSFDKKNILELSDFFNEQNIQILNEDFESSLKNVKKKDFVFFDSPYAPIKSDSFEAYTKEGFTYEDHVRLAALYKKLSSEGVYCMLTNHNTELINDLYKDFNIEVVSVKRMINSDANKRTGEEVIITNY